MKGLHAALHDDHLRLDALFEELQSRVHAGDAAAAQETWAAFEQGLLAHLEAEERFMLPVFEREDPDEAVVIRNEHDKIRALLADIGVGLEIHTAREARVDDFVSFLRAHAKREEDKLYQWAEGDLPEEQSRSVLDRIRAAVLAGAEAVKRSIAAPPVL
jgi:hemerythrin superfamily protein